MENLENAYIKSLLSKVAYENGVDVGYNFNFLGTGFSDAEREYLNENYKVIGTKHTESGLDLIIVENLVTGENTISIAGTYLPSEDLSLGVTGIAHKQFIELYNYYQQITHAYGENILQITELVNPIYEPEEPYLRIETAEDEYTYYLLETVENNQLPIDEFVALNTSNLSFTGHSLGGHLAGIMSIVTEKEATVFNAPSYKKNTTLTSGCEYVKTDGSIEKTTSDFDALICKLLNIDDPKSKEGHIIHYQNGYGGGFSESIAGKWDNTEKIYCLSGSTDWLKEHTINEMCLTFYAYFVIKDIANGAESFNNNSNLTSFKETFENVYKAYCLQFNLNYQTLDYSNYTYIQNLLSSIQIWSETQKEKGGLIKIDSYNHSVSLPLNGTNGNDIMYTGGGDDTVNAGSGDDIVYGMDLKGDIAALAKSTKNIHLGAGNDTYYGSNAKDIVKTTGNNTEGDVNHVYLGGGSDEFHGGDGNDIVDGGSGLNEDKDSDINTIHLGNGKNKYTGSRGVDIVYGGNERDVIHTGEGNDVIHGGEGSDILCGSGGENIIYCGSDRQTDWIMTGTVSGKTAVV